MLRSVELKDIRIHDAYWDDIIRLIQDTVIPYQWDALNDHLKDVEPSHVIRNFRIAAGLEEGEFGGMVFQDSDLAKWIEASSYSLQLRPDAELEERVDEVVELIGKAQRPDGYMDTYYIIKEPENRWKNLLQGHELYCAGHMIEAGVAYYQVTGKAALLSIVCAYADYIDTVFGTEPGKLRGYPGHEEIELALARLYDATGKEKYLKLAEYFIDERGGKPSYFDTEWERNGRFNFWTQSVTERPNPEYGDVDHSEYNQTHLPVREQKKATGHAVRALYLYTGMAEVAARTGDATLFEACRALWDDVVNAQMYVTGGVGSTAVGEAFTFDYDLPNDTVYAETCASIALVFFARAMFQTDPDASYFDIVERVLYNVLPASMQQDGKHYNYTNPLEVWPERLGHSPLVTHIKPVRQSWFACACCPPNLARTLTSLGRYVFSTSESGLYTHLFVGCEAELSAGDMHVRLTMQSDYPQNGNVSICMHPEHGGIWTLYVRKPGWCRSATLQLNGVPMEAPLEKGYWAIERNWEDGDTLAVELEMRPVFVQANPKVRADAGRVCLTRGPVVYCLEQTDNGDNLSALRALPDLPITDTKIESLPCRAVGLKLSGMRREATSDALYAPYEARETPVMLLAVPYAYWGNRTPGEMLVWIRV
ncbi:MAG: glycoside hydrolase family 127 protein [Eubacteriales bacterium]|nr:glycoside hydrolase family 127 protein [Eubacteriales bacterium]